MRRQCPESQYFLILIAFIGQQEGGQSISEMQQIVQLREHVRHAGFHPERKKKGGGGKTFLSRKDCLKISHGDGFLEASGTLFMLE